MESLLKRDRLIVLTALAGMTLLAWGYMVYESRAMYHTGVCCCAGMKMSAPDTGAWSTASLAPLFLMWSEMMVAMMLPSAAPMILTFASVNRLRREHERPFVRTGVFLLGYLIVWIGFSALAAVAQWFLHARALLSPMMVSTSPLLAGALLLFAGVFQWTHFKNMCLSQCRSPLSFLMADWREGRLGALVMGLKHGAFCTGCCWILMVLLFVAGVMNMWLVAIISILVLLEKVIPKGTWFSRAAGVFLALWGVGMMAMR